MGQLIAHSYSNAIDLKIFCLPILNTNTHNRVLGNSTFLVDQIVRLSVVCLLVWFVCVFYSLRIRASFVGFIVVVFASLYFLAISSLFLLLLNVCSRVFSFVVPIKLVPLLMPAFAFQQL